MATREPKAKKEQWAPSVKTELGDVWHRLLFDGAAHCNPRIRLSVADAKPSPPADAYRCKRCVALTDIYHGGDK